MSEFYTIITNIGTGLISQAINGTSLKLAKLGLSEYSGELSSSASRLNDEYTQVSITNVCKSSDDALLVAETLLPDTLANKTINSVGVYTSNGELFALARLPRIDTPNQSVGAKKEINIKIYLAITKEATLNISLANNANVSEASLQASLSDLKRQAQEIYVQKSELVSSVVANGGEPVKYADDGRLEAKGIKTGSSGSNEIRNSTTFYNTVCCTSSIQTSTLRINKDSEDSGHISVWHTDDFAKYHNNSKKLDIIFLGGINSTSNSGVYAPGRDYDGGKSAASPDRQVRAFFIDDFVAEFATPAGSIIAHAGSSVPTGFLLCDGSTISRSKYKRLFAAIGTTYGSGNGSTTFSLPDLRGKFIRGYGGNSASMGVTQSDAIRNIVGEFGAGDTSSSMLTTVKFNASSVVPTANENRPINMAVKFYIKY